MHTPEGYKKWHDSFLRKPCSFLTSSEIQTEQVQDCIDSMKSFLIKSRGIYKIGAITANVLGQSYPIVVVEFGENDLQEIINPRYIALSKEKNLAKERCLTFPAWFQFPVRRSEDVIVAGLDRDGREKTFLFYDEGAQLIMHELDHLKGIRMIDAWKRFCFLWKIKNLYQPRQEMKGLFLRENQGSRLRNPFVIELFSPPFEFYCLARI